MNFKDFLAEKALNDKVFKAAIERMSGDAKLGFELEMWVPEESGLLIISPEDSSIGDFNETAKQAKESLEDLLGTTFEIDTTNIDKWRIVQDNSIQDEGLGCGIEVISPPQPVEDALGDLKQCFKWMIKNDVVTNSTTGIHLNLSISDLKDKLDPVKLILFMGETHLLQSYERQTNSYAKKHYNDMIDGISRLGIIPKTADAMIERAYMAIKKEKHRTVNLGKLDKGYLEFRTAGNARYETKLNQIERDVGRFLTVIELACDPNAERKEYLKKIAKLYGKGREPSNIK